jgi:nucleotide-binding universal stress UspA family protein
VAIDARVPLHRQRLLVSLDGSAGSENILRYARAVAGRFGSEIVLLSVPEDDSEETKIQHYLESVAAALRKRGLQARALVTGSGPARTIVAVSESENADLVMMATRGRGGTAGNIAIGSVAERVVQVTQCPVFLVPIRNGSERRQRPRLGIVQFQ